MADLTVSDVRPFVPALHFETSRTFYLALGWTELWREDGLSLLSLAGSRMVLQDYYVRAWAENSMLIVEVTSADDWHAHVTEVLATGAYADARLDEPRDEGWARVTHVWDPSGVLLHFAQLPPRG